jgi:DNA transformation protein and related proteins
MRDETFKDYVLDQLIALSGITSRRMFGGYGLYRNGNFFGIIYKGRLYFRTTPDTVSSYREHGMKPFRARAKQTLKSYYEVPVNIIEDAEPLSAWAEQAARPRPHMRRTPVNKKTRAGPRS